MEKIKKAKLGRVANFINGRAFKPTEWDVKGTPIIRIQNLNGSKEFNYFNGEIESKYIVKNNELLFSWSGSRGTSFGPHIWGGENGVLNQHIFKVLPHKKIDKIYLFYELKRITKEIEHNAHGSAGLVHITKGDLEEFEINLPENREQERIAIILSVLDKNIEKTLETIEKYKKVKNGLMDDLLTGKIRIKDGKWVEETEFKFEEGIGSIPNYWEVSIHSKVANIIDSLHETPKYSLQGYNMIRVIDINEGKLDVSNAVKVDEETYWKFTKKYKPMKDDILMSRVGTYGVTCYINNNEKICLGQNIVCISSLINAKYLYFLLNSKGIKRQIERVTVGSSQKTLSLENINNLKIIFPNKDEQQEISNILLKQDQLIEKEEQYLQKLQKLKNGLMEDLLTGKKRVNID